MDSEEADTPDVVDHCMRKKAKLGNLGVTKYDMKCCELSLLISILFRSSPLKQKEQTPTRAARPATSSSLLLNQEERELFVGLVSKRTGRDIQKKSVSINLVDFEWRVPNTSIARLDKRQS
ncbi:unnamed protein product [Pleuronectes platessa]|uniref:Uncharacterized protein n=1 Tax=Pleuronectes platessa TaxID=8262 RepID=A0A9N7UQ27_PLEPL|nr:unnamed protein product [Pleuronectes platessa]